MTVLRIATALALLVGLDADARQTEFRDVRHEWMDSVDEANGRIAVTFAVDGPALVRLRVFDAREIAIREIVSPGTLPEGAHGLEWDLRDWMDRELPPGAYHYQLVAEAPDGTISVWDPTDSSGGHRLRSVPVSLSPEKDAIEYTLGEPARVRIRLGLENNGPLLRTLVDWVARGSGPQSEPWDGLDASGEVPLAEHPRLALRLDAFALPRNAILIGRTTSRPALIEGEPDDAVHREIAPRRRHVAHDYARQAVEERGDLETTILLPDSLEERDGRPVVVGPVPVRIDVGAEAARRLANQRFEAVFFVDGHFAFESETAFLPFTWRWDPRDSPPGKHYITVNLRGYEGHYGIATIPIEVEKHAN